MTTEEEFKEIFMAPKPTTTTEVIVFCQYGIKARVIADMLAVNFGFQNVKLYQGSYFEWRVLGKMPYKKQIELEINF